MKKKKYDLALFTEYDSRPLAPDHKVLIWSRQMGYMFMRLRQVRWPDHLIIAYEVGKS